MTGLETSQFALFLNGILIPGSIYGIGAGSELNAGMAIITANPNDVLTLRNHTSSTAINLSLNEGGSNQNVNASILIRKIA